MGDHLGNWRVLLLILVAIAAASDLRSMRIPNLLPLAILAALVGRLVLHSAPLADYVDAAGAGLVALMIGYALFAFNLMGAGDGKLFAACAAWFGLGGLLALSFWISVSGVAVSLACLAALALRKPAAAGAGATRPTLRQALRTRIPFGVAIAAGAAIVVVSSGGEGGSLY